MSEKQWVKVHREFIKKDIYMKYGKQNNMRDMYWTNMKTSKEKHMANDTIFWVDTRS